MQSTHTNTHICLMTCTRNAPLACRSTVALIVPRIRTGLIFINVHAKRTCMYTYTPVVCNNYECFYSSSSSFATTIASTLIAKLYKRAGDDDWPPPPPLPPTAQSRVKTSARFGDTSPTFATTPTQHDAQVQNSFGPPFCE